jgi:hypothetical protein
MDGQYRVMFEECGGFSAGAVVPGRHLARSMAGLEYLLKVGAIVAVAGPAGAWDKSDRSDHSDESDPSEMSGGPGKQKLRQAGQRGGRAGALKENVNG